MNGIYPSFDACDLSSSNLRKSQDLDAIQSTLDGRCTSFEGTSVLNPLPLPQPLPSQICHLPTPASEPRQVDLTFPAVDFADIADRDAKASPASFMNIQDRRVQLRDAPILHLSNLPASLTRLPNAATSISTLSTCDTVGTLSTEYSANQNVFVSTARYFHHNNLTPLGSSNSGNPLGTPEDVMISLAPTPPHESVLPQTQQPEGADFRSEAEDSSQQQASLNQDIANAAGSEEDAESHSNDEWLSDVIPRLLEAIHRPSNDASSSQIRVLTHALPLPSLEGYTFPKVLSGIHTLLTPQRTTWISHWHAVSGRFNISQLPTTPPTTPAPPHEGEDYFTIRTFDSAVAVPDYQQVDDQPPRLTVSLPLSSDVIRASTAPRPAVPPSSVNISITERYIPPASPSEFLQICNPSSGRSLLSDRLVELSDDNGIFIFIYPTKKGGQTFLREYLNPALDPLLRRMMIVNNLSIDVCQEIGGMLAAEKLPTFEDFKMDLQNFCRDMSASSTNVNSNILKLHSSTGVQTNLQLIYAKTQEMPLTAEVWTNWWCRQEKPRIRRIFENHVRQSASHGRVPLGSSPIVNGTPSYMRSRHEVSLEGSSMTQILEVLNGVESNARERSRRNAASGIEVGIFVIQKTRADAAER